MIWIKNGGYVPYVYQLITNWTNNYFLGVILALRLITINYFYWFMSWTLYEQLKQNVRFTDCGTLVSLLYTIDPQRYEGVCYAINWLITVGFWTGKSLGFNETLKKPKREIICHTINKLYHYLNHGLMLLIVSVKSERTFITNDFLMTLGIIVYYLCLVYLPWYLMTGDTIYM